MHHHHLHRIRPRKLAALTKRVEALEDAVKALQGGEPPAEGAPGSDDDAES